MNCTTAWYREILAVPDHQIIRLAAKEWHEIDNCEDKDPHHVNKVPVHLTSLQRKVLLLSKITANSTDQTDQQKDRTDCHMQTVKTSQGEERRPKGASLKVKTSVEQLIIFESLATQEDKA